MSIYNAINVNLSNNYYTSKIVNPNSEETNDDVYHLEFCQDFVVSSNFLNYSGENGLDILSCQRGVIENNNFLSCDVWGISLEEADTLRDFSKTIPNIRATLKKNIY